MEDLHAACPGAHCVPCICMDIHIWKHEQVDRAHRLNLTGKSFEILRSTCREFVEGLNVDDKKSQRMNLDYGNIVF